LRRDAHSLTGLDNHAFDDSVYVQLSRSPDYRWGSCSDGAGVHIDDRMNESDLMDLPLRAVLDVKSVTEQLGYRHRYCGKKFRDVRELQLILVRLYYHH
jgi:hypothetical protein